MQAFIYSLFNLNKMKNKYTITKSVLTGVCTFLCAAALQAQPGTPDPGFVTGTGFTDNGNVAYIAAMTLQPDGKIVSAGSFTGYNGTARKNIIRLNADGSNDGSFSPGTGFDEMVSAIVRQTDGKLIAGGNFTSYNGVTNNAIVRINANGSHDASFSSGSGFGGKKGAGSVSALALQSDGKVLAGGNFIDYNGTGVENLVRLNTGGTLDGTFSASVNNGVSQIVIQPDGKIIIAGNFTEVNGTARARIARLNANGTLDGTFNPGSGFDQSVRAIILQPDGKIVANGSFTTYNGTASAKIARINANGTIDASFNTGTGFGSENPFSLALQPDGKIIVGGNFLSYNGTNSKCLIRINSDGAVDTSLKTGTGFVNGANSNGQLWQLIPQPDGKLLIGGIFTGYNGQSYNGIIRLEGYTPALSIVSLSPATGYCIGTNVAVQFSTGIGSFNTGNTFTAQLSDAAGNFTSPTNIGTLTGTASGIITAAIPTGTTAGTGYRIRVVSSNPAQTGPDNGSNISVISGTVPSVTANASASAICAGEQVTLTATAGSGTISWDNSVTNGTPFTPAATTTYTATATSGGCSNTAQVTVTVHPLPVVVATASDDTVCKGGQVTVEATGAATYTWDNGVSNNQPFTANTTTTYTVTGTDANNCSNTDQVTITVLEPGANTIDATICVGDTYQLGTQSLSAAGIYTESIAGAAANGCDSIITLNLSVAPDDVSVTRDGQTLTATETNATYQWINCADNSVITGAINQNFTPNLPGVFAVIITQNGCSDTSDCVPVWPAGIATHEGESGFRMYPNPVYDRLTISGENIDGIIVADITGKVLYHVIPAQPATQHTIPAATWHEGIYIIRITTGATHQVYKIRKAN